MKVEGTFTIDAEREKVWGMLMSPETLAGCIPGCEGLEPVDADYLQCEDARGSRRRARELQRQREYRG